MQIDFEVAEKILAVVDVNSINNPAFDERLADLQNVMNIQYGDTAGLFFSEYGEAWSIASKEERIKILKKYIKYEESFQ